MLSAATVPLGEPACPARTNIDLRRTKGEVYRRLSGPLKRLPDFLIIGAGNSGTTSLYRYLLDLPWVTGPFYKEVNFFSYRWHLGPAFYRSRFPLDLRQRLAAAQAGTRALVGEASPTYLVYPFVAERVAQVVPRAKLLVMLRNPVDRAYSCYRHAVHWGWEPLSFEEALDREEPRLAAGGYPADQADERLLLFSAAYHLYARTGLYAEHLARWLAVFPREQLLIVDSRDLFSHTGAVMQQVCDFLGTLNVPRESYTKYRYGRDATPYEPMAPATRARLADYFRPRNEELFELLGRRFEWDP